MTPCGQGRTRRNFPRPGTIGGAVGRMLNAEAGVRRQQHGGRAGAPHAGRESRQAARGDHFTVGHCAQREHTDGRRGSVADLQAWRRALASTLTQRDARDALGFSDQRAVASREALVATRGIDQRRVGPHAGGVHARQSTIDRALAQAVGRAQQASQGRSVPLGDVDARLLHQSGGQDAQPATPRRARTGEGRAAERLWPQKTRADCSCSTQVTGSLPKSCCYGGDACGVLWPLRREFA
jgi:hypothetical protein